MWRHLALFLFPFFFFSLENCRADKSRVRADHLSVSLVGGVKEGESIRIGVEFVLDPEWHVYWKNPGDSGTAPKFTFVVKEGEVSGPQWPAPERVKLGDLTNYGYHQRVVFPFLIRSIANTPKINVTVNLEWLVCKVECLPGFAKLDRVFYVAGTDAEKERLVDAAHPLPQESSPFLARATANNGSEFSFTLENVKGREGIALEKVQEIDVFPEDGELFATSAPVFQLEKNGWTAKLKWDANATQTTKTTQLLVKIRQAETWQAFVQPLDLTLSAPWSELGRTLFFAFLGGILLNLMPCVFPVLSIKVLSLVRENEDSTKLKRGGWLYSAGVVSTFLALASLLLFLRAGGEKLGWGFQLQSPTFVLAMAVLFFLVGLNFLGVFEFGDSIARLGGGAQSVRFLQSSFGTGVLATLVATPCTAPFMGTALGVSLLLPWFASLGVFAALGFGMAVPFLALCYFPAAMRWLPRPGVWMEKLKEFLAFPLFATTVWLGWVLVRQSADRGFLALGLAVVGISLASWILKTGTSKFVKVLGWLIALGSLAGAIGLVSIPNTNVEASTTAWSSYQAVRVEEARREGHGVFIDFTAAWCLTCQWNKKSVLETAPVLALFETNQVKLFRADWTDRDPAVTEALASYGRNSVPLYVFLPPKGEAVILPELITRRDIEGLFQSGNATTKE